MIDELKALRVEAAALRRERDQLQLNVAAARRECDAMREVLNTIRRGGGGMDPLGRMEMSRIARDAIAAPGAAPDTSPATLEAWEKRLEREAEVNDPNESEP